MTEADQHSPEPAFIPAGRGRDDHPRGVYAITPDDGDDSRLLARCDAVLRGGAVWLQYRNKAADPATRHRQATRLLPLCRFHAAKLIVNDDIELAAAVGADGVHLGGDDGSIADARRRMGTDAIIGVSCYNRLELAQQAAEEGAGYLAFGAFFPSPTKPQAVRASTGLLGQSRPLGLPRVAIGGINADNARSLIDAGADLIAVITAVFDAADPEQATRKLARLFRD